MAERVSQLALRCVMVATLGHILATPSAKARPIRETVIWRQNAWSWDHER